MYQMLQPNDVLRGRYVILRQLGQGGMGSVYLAMDRQFDRYVAIKENFQTSEASRKQFEIEARILGKLKHRNLPWVIEHFEESNNRQYLVMEYIEGEDFHSIVKRQGRLTENQTLASMSQVFDALEYLHTQKPEPVIHRDIKPSNLKLRAGVNQEVMLVDFGIAKQLSAQAQTIEGAKAVSPGFSPPEQYGSSLESRTDERSDIYALGATMYFLLTGQVPTEAPVRSAQRISVTPVDELNHAVSENTSRVIIDMIQVDPRERYQTISAVRNAFGLTSPLPAVDSQDRRSSVPPPSTPPESTHLLTFSLSQSQILTPRSALRIPLKADLKKVSDDIFKRTRQGLVDNIMEKVLERDPMMQGLTIILHGHRGTGTSKLSDEIRRITNKNGGQNCIVAMLNLSDQEFAKEPLRMWEHIVRGFAYQLEHKSYEACRGIAIAHEVLKPSSEMPEKEREYRRDRKVIFKFMGIPIPAELIGEVGDSTVVRREPIPDTHAKETKVAELMVEHANYLNKHRGRMVLILNKVQHIEILKHLRSFADQPGVVIVTVVDEEDYQRWYDKDPDLLAHFSSTRSPIYVECLRTLPIEFCNELLKFSEPITKPEFKLFMRYLEYWTRGRPHKIMDVLSSLCNQGHLLVELNKLREWYKYAILEDLIQSKGWSTWFPDVRDPHQSSLNETYDAVHRDMIREGIYDVLDTLMSKSQSQGEVTTKEMIAQAMAKGGIGGSRAKTTQIINSIMNTLHLSGRVKQTKRGWDCSGLSQFL